MKERIGQVDICGLPFSVYLADEEGEPDIRTCYGLCSTARQEILIHAALSYEARRLYLVHEILHAIWDHGGTSDVLKGAKPSEREELVIRTLTPHLLRALDSSRDLPL